MNIKVHYTVNGVEDEVHLSGTLEEIKENIAVFIEKMGLDSEGNNMWSEQV